MRRISLVLAAALIAAPAFAGSKPTPTPTPNPTAASQRHDTPKSIIQNIKAREKATVTPTPSTERGKPSKEQRVLPTVTPGKE